MGRLDLNTKKSFSTILEISILRVGKEENAEFRKYWIFEHDLALSYSTEKKFHMRGLDLNTKKAT